MLIFSDINIGGSFLNPSNIFLLFQAIKEALDSIQPAVETADSRVDGVLDNMALEQDKEEVMIIMDELHNEWKQLNTNYNDKHRYVYRKTSLLSRTQCSLVIKDVQ